MKRSSFIIVFLLGMMAHFTLTAQNRPALSFTAFADAESVLLNNYFELVFSINTDQATNFVPPRFTDFNVVSGPMQGFNQTTRNGQRSTEISISYRLQPKRVGRLTIQPAKVSVNGTVLETKPITIEAVAASNSNVDNTPEAFIVARLSSDTAYLGQQVTLDYVLYSRVDVRKPNLLSESDYDGLYFREIYQFDQRVKREIIDGVQYTAKVQKRLSLFPQQTGVITVDPLQIVAGVPIEGQRRNNSFFSTVELRRIEIGSESVTLTVLPLPEPKPENFSFITGNFQLRANFNRTKISTDDAVSLKLTFEGQGDLKRLQAPELNIPEAFEVYEPKVVQEEYLDLPNNNKGRKVFEYLLVPRQAGQFRITPKVVVFDPLAQQYETLSVPPLNLEVTQGSGKKQSGLVAEAEQNQGLYPPRASISLSRPGNGLMNGPTFWAVFALPFLLLGGYLGYERVLANRPEVDPVLRQQQLARKQALQHLATAETHRQADNPRAFYAEVERALLGFVSDKLQIPRAELTKANVREKLATLPTTTPEKVERYMQLIRTCEMALYAGQDNAAAMETNYEAAVSLLVDFA